jgi:tripartite-type tricarboxylate transporter receptor subunit TctC
MRTLLPITRSSAGRAAVFTLCLSVGHVAGQMIDPSRFPSKPIRMIVPFPPSGSNDIIARFLAREMSGRLEQQVIVDNRAGADGIIGTELAARSPPDGHTLLLVSRTFTMNPALHKLSYDSVTSFAPIALLASGPNVITATPSLPVKTVNDLIALAKAKPGQLHYSSSGIGGFNHFSGELFKTMAGVNITHIPYKGGGPAMLDVMSGQVEITFGTLIQALPHIRSGKLKALGVGSLKRSRALPEVPTISESAVPGYDASMWWGVLSPAGLPAPIVTKLNSEINAILREPEMAKRLSAEAAEPVISTPSAFGTQIVNDIALWARVAKQTGIKSE